jgi:four helix bundle protein
MFVAQNIIPKFPIEEKYALTSQLRRSSRSVSDNIAEGYGRFIIKKIFSFVELQEVHCVNH